MKLLLFDIDGTLVNKKGHWNSMLSAVEDVTGKKAERINASGMCDLAIISELAKNSNIDEEKIREIIEKTVNNFKKTTHEIVPMSGAVNLLKKLSKDNILGLVTGNMEGVAWEKMKRSGLKHFFELGSFGNESKVRSDLIKNAVKKAKEKYEFDETIVFGDSPNDIKAAKEANVKVIAIATGSESREELEKYNPDYLFDNLKERKIIEIINS